jgi:hypothetical protein
MQVAYAPSGHGPVLSDREESDLSVALDEIGLSQPLMFHVAGIGLEANTGHRAGSEPRQVETGLDSTGETALDSTILHGLVHP